MKLRQRLQEDTAVSPVIGVILMVAITVILAAVIATFALGMGPNTATTPTATFSSEFNEPDTGSSTVTITMESGKTLSASALSIKGTNISDSHKASISSDSYLDDEDAEITAGTSFTVELSSDTVEDYEINLIYTSGDTTSTMQTFED